MSHLNIFAKFAACYFYPLLIKMQALISIPQFAFYVTCLATVGVMRFLCVASATHFFYWGGETMNYDEWLENALSKISTLQIGSVFEVKDLFDSIEWNKQESKDKRFFGKYFSCKYNDGVIKGIERVDYDKKISNRYRKTL